MEHPDKQELTEFMYQELPPARQAEVMRHLEQCEECREVVTSWRMTRDIMQHWQLPTPVARSASLRRAVFPLQLARWAVAAIVLLGFGYGIGRISVMREADSIRLRAELTTQLRDQLHAEFAKFIADQSALQQQANQRALIAAATQLDARRLADYASLRRDVETVALQTQEKFNSLAVPESSDLKSAAFQPVNSGNP